MDKVGQNMLLQLVKLQFSNNLIIGSHIHSTESCQSCSPLNFFVKSQFESYIAGSGLTGIIYHALVTPVEKPSHAQWILLSNYDGSLFLQLLILLHHYTSNYLSHSSYTSESHMQICYYFTGVFSITCLMFQPSYSHHTTHLCTCTAFKITWLYSTFLCCIYLKVSVSWSTDYVFCLLNSNIIPLLVSSDIGVSNKSP